MHNTKAYISCKQAQNILPASIVKSCIDTPKHVTIDRRISLVEGDLTIHESDLREVLKALRILKERKMGLEIRNTDSKNMDFIELVKLLDKDLEERYGDLQKQYDKHNKADYINDVVIAYKDNVPVACGAFKKQDDCTAEIKRIFVTKENRHQGISKLILNKLEELIRSKGHKYAVLETGIKQLEAINLYKNSLYEIIENYEPYAGNTNSVCMRKVL